MCAHPSLDSTELIRVERQTPRGRPTHAVLEQTLHLQHFSQPRQQNEVS